MLKQMHFAALSTTDSGGNNTLKEKGYYYSDLDFFFCLLRLHLRCAAYMPGVTFDTTVQVTQSYNYCITWKNAFGAQGQWRILIIHCRPWKLSGPFSALHPSFWLSHSGQVCLAKGVEEHLEVKGKSPHKMWNPQRWGVCMLVCCLFARHKLFLCL